MLLSSNVIKQVSYELENCSVYPRVKLHGEGTDIVPATASEPEAGNVESVQDEAELVLQKRKRKRTSY